MKAVKGLGLFCFLGALISSCFEPPEYSIVPKITFNNIQFKVTPDPADADSLIITLDFTDGDGDLGLGDAYTNDPYHERNFYFENAGSIQKVGTVLQRVNRPPYPATIPMIVTEPTGKLITHRTRNKPGYNFLPAFSSANLNCREYTNQYLIIAPSAKNAVDNSYAIADTLFDQAGNQYLLLKDTLHFTANLNYFNIIVRFYQSTGGPFTEFSWEDEFCTTFNGRFPVLADKTGVPLDGTLRYAMTSTGFQPLFSIKNLRLDVIIKDRAFHKDSIRTPEFTLDKIRVN